MITFIDGIFNTTLPNGLVYSVVAVSALVTIALYLLRSIGLFVMVKRAEIKHAFIAWIPFVWVYTACKLIGGKAIFFGKPINKLAIIFSVIYAVSGVLTFVYNFLVDFPLIGNFLMGRELSVLFIDGTMGDVSEFTKGLTQYWGNPEIFYGSDFVDPYGDGVYALINFLNVLSWVSLPFDIASIFVVIVTYSNLFKRYLPNHYLLATIVSLFGFFGPFVFAVRKKEPVNYMDYLRSRYQAYGPYGNPYGMPPRGQRPPEHPFTEFAERNEVDPGDPFKEFSDDKKDE